MEKLKVYTLQDCYEIENYNMYMHTYMCAWHAMLFSSSRTAVSSADLQSSFPQVLCLTGLPGVFTLPLETQPSHLPSAALLCFSFFYPLVLPSQEISPQISSNSNTWNLVAPLTWKCVWISEALVKMQILTPVGLGWSPQLCISSKHLVQGLHFQQQGPGMRLLL